MSGATTPVTLKDRYIYISKISSFWSWILSSFTNFCSLQIHYRTCFLKRAKLNTTYWLKLHFWSNSSHILSLRASAKLGRATSSFVMSIHLYGKTWLPLGGFSWNFESEYFSKICREYSGSIKVWKEQQLLYMKTNKHLWSFYICRSVHRNSRLKKSNKMQLYADIYYR